DVAFERIAEPVECDESVGAQRIRGAYEGRAPWSGYEARKRDPARVVVVPKAEIERELVEGRPEAAVEIDLGRRVIGEIDALAGVAVVELQILVDVVSQLAVGRDRGLVRGLRDAAELVVVHQRAAKGDVPRRGHRGRGRRRLHSHV